MKEQEDKWENAIRKSMNQTRLESPSMDFTQKVMGKIEEEFVAESHNLAIPLAIDRHSYTPLISRQVAVWIAVSFTILMVIAYFTSLGNAANSSLVSIGGSADLDRVYQVGLEKVFVWEMSNLSEWVLLVFAVGGLIQILYIARAKIIHNSYPPTNV